MSSPRPLELQRLSGKSSQLLMGQLLSYSSHMCGDAHYRVYVIMYTYVVCNVTVLNILRMWKLRGRKAKKAQQTNQLHPGQLFFSKERRAALGGIRTHGTLQSRRAIRATQLVHAHCWYYMRMYVLIITTNLPILCFICTSKTPTLLPTPVSYSLPKYRLLYVTFQP